MVSLKTFKITAQVPENYQIRESTRQLQDRECDLGTVKHDKYRWIPELECWEMFISIIPRADIQHQLSPSRFEEFLSPLGNPDRIANVGEIAVGIGEAEWSIQVRALLVPGVGQFEIETAENAALCLMWAIDEMLTGLNPEELASLQEDVMAQARSDIIQSVPTRTIWGSPDFDSYET
jgi:hypothetical protein